MSIFWTMNPHRKVSNVLYNSLSSLGFQWVWTEHVCSCLDLLCDNAWLKAGGQRSNLAGARDHTHPYKCREASAVHTCHFSGSHTNRCLLNLCSLPKIKCTVWNRSKIKLLISQIKYRLNHFEKQKDIASLKSKFSCKKSANTSLH